MYGLRIDGLTRAIRHPGGELVVVRELSLAVAPGQAIGLTGPADGGWRAALRLVAGLDPLSAGTIELVGRPDLPPPPKASTPLFRQQVIHAAALGPLLAGEPHATCRQVATLAASRQRQVRLPPVAEIAQLALVAGEGPWSERSPFERYLLQLALAWALRPSQILVDGHPPLDLPDRRRLTDMLRRMLAGGLGLLIGSQDEVLLAGVCGHIVVMTDGDVLAEGAPADVIPAAVARAAAEGRGA